jgi:hypothetical protein
MRYRQLYSFSTTGRDQKTGCERDCAEFGRVNGDSNSQAIQKPEEQSLMMPNEIIGLSSAQIAQISLRVTLLAGLNTRL